MKTQEPTRRLNLSNLPDKQKHDFLHDSEDRNRLFGPAVAKMQKRCEEIEGEALQKLCLPRQTEAAPAPHQGGPPVQNADTHGCASFYVPRRLVHPSQPEGCVFSHTSICLPVCGGGFDVPENMPKAIGTFGFSYGCHPLRPPNCEGFSTGACIPQSGLLTRLHCYVRVSVEYMMALHQ